MHLIEEETISQPELVADIQQRSNVPAAGVPVLDFDPYSDEVLTDPYEHYRLLRETGPLVWLQKYGVYALRPLRDRYARTHQSVSILIERVGLTNFHTEKPWRNNSPEHSRNAEVFIRILSPRALNKLRERFENDAHGSGEQCAPHCRGMRRPRHMRGVSRLPGRRLRDAIADDG